MDHPSTYVYVYRELGHKRLKQSLQVKEQTENKDTATTEMKHENKWNRTTLHDNTHQRGNEYTG